MSGDKDVAKDAFQRGVHCFFPSSRAETPYWLNVEGMPQGPRFEVSERTAGSVKKKPFFVERSMEQITSWILDVFLDARVDAPAVVQHIGSPSTIFPELLAPLQSFTTVTNIISILRKIMNDDTVNLLCLGRETGLFRLRPRSDTAGVIPSLANLSAGQSTLLSIFAPSCDTRI